MSAHFSKFWKVAHFFEKIDLFSTFYGAGCATRKCFVKNVLKFPKTLFKHLDKWLTSNFPQSIIDPTPVTPQINPWSAEYACCAAGGNGNQLSEQQVLDCDNNDAGCIRYISRRVTSLILANNSKIIILSIGNIFDNLLKYFHYIFDGKYWNNWRNENKSFPIMQWPGNILCGLNSL